MRYLTTLVAMLFAACSAPVHMVKQNVMGTLMPQPQVHALLQEVVSRSRYSMPKIEPVIDVVPEATWMKQVCPGIEDPDDCTSLGYYVDWLPEERGVVHIRDIPQTIVSRPINTIAVHELTHYLQSYSGWRYVKGDCETIAEQEMEAYSIEYIYDLQHGNIRGFYMPEVMGQCLMGRVITIIKGN